MQNKNRTDRDIDDSPLNLDKKNLRSKRADHFSNELALKNTNKTSHPRFKNAAKMIKELNQFFFEVAKFFGF